MWVFTSLNHMLVPVVSTTSAMAGFTVAIAAGMLAENPIVSILERGLISLGVCYLGGLIVGYLLEGVIERHAQELRDSGADEAGSDDSSLDPLEIETHDQRSGMGSIA